MAVTAHAARRVVAVRHGETAWSVSGQHTGTTDIPLTDDGRRLAARLRAVVAGESFALVLTSPLQRARETCALCGLADTAVIEPDLVEKLREVRGTHTRPDPRHRAGLADLSRRLPGRRDAGRGRG